MGRDQKTAGVLLHYGSEAVKILTVLVYTPVMLRLLGQIEYGLYQMVAAVISNLALLQFGFGSAYVRFFARCGSKEEIARLNGLFLLIFTALAVLCLLCGGWMAANARLIFGSGLTEGELGRARLLLGILTGNLSLVFLNTPFDCHVAARERFRFQNLLRLLQSVCSPFLTLPLLLMGYGSPSLAAVSAILTLAALVGNGAYCRYRLGMAVCFRGLPLGLLKELWVFAFFLFLNQLIDQINWSVDRFLLGRMMGTSAVAVYGIGAQINTLYIQLSTAVCGVFVPEIHRMNARQASGEALTQMMIRVGKIQLQILLLVLSGFYSFGPPFLRLWAGEGYGESYMVALLLMVPMTVPLLQNLGIEIQRAKNRHRARSLAYACLALGNLILSIVLIPRWGPSGAAAGTAVTLVLGTGVFMNWYYQKKLSLNMGLFWKELGKTCLIFLPVVLLGRWIASILEIQSWGMLLAASSGYALLYGLAVLGIQKRGTGQSLSHGN